MPKKKNNSSKASQAKAKTKESREKAYVDSLDLKTMWESYSLDINENGTQRFKTVWQFITKHTKVIWQRDLLYWMLGPVVTENPASPYKEFPQFDWEARRTKGHWYASKNVEDLQHSLKDKEFALQKIAALGGVNLENIGRLQTIMQQIDKEFAQGIFLPSLSQKENAMRAQLFMDLNRQVLEQSKLAQEMYGKTQGVNLEQLTQFLTMFASGMGQAAGLGASMGIFAPQKDNQNSDMRDISAQLIDMVTEKAVSYDMPLPDEKMTEIVLQARPKLVKKG